MIYQTPPMNKYNGIYHLNKIYKNLREISEWLDCIEIEDIPEGSLILASRSIESAMYHILDIKKQLEG